MLDIEEMRKQCGNWSPELGCMDDYPDECPISVECEEKEEAEGE